MQKYDAVIVGAGHNGLVCANYLGKAGLKVLVATKLRHGDSNTVMAEGGIQAADQEGRAHAQVEQVAALLAGGLPVRK